MTEQIPQQNEGKKVIVLYHGHCLDGFGAAYAAWEYYRDAADYVPVSYNKLPPYSLLANKRVYIVDFSYPAEIIHKIAGIANDVIILDHHESAQKELLEFLPTDMTMRPYEKVYAEFDMNRSGAMITWDYFHIKPAPPLIQVIQDRDLWHKRLPHTDAITAALASFLYSFHGWKKLMHATKELAVDGMAILRARNQMVDQVVASAFEADVHCGDGKWERVMVANCPGFLASDVGAILSKNYCFSVTYWDTKDGRSYSLRSQKDEADVSAIAKRYGGGGHKNAAGCSDLLYDRLYKEEEEKK